MTEDLLRLYSSVFISQFHAILNFVLYVPFVVALSE